MARCFTSPTRQQGTSQRARRSLLARRAGLVCTVAVLALGFVLWSRADDSPAKTETQLPLRRPIALVIADAGKRLYAANRDSGTISVVDTVAARSVAEVAIGRKLADLAITPDNRRLLAVDEDAGELVILNRQESGVQVASRVNVSPAPVTVRVAADGSQCTVASLWSWRLSVVVLDKMPRVIRTIDLPFAPRAHFPLVGGKRVIVADAFGGRLAVVDAEHGVVESVRALPAHNIRGLALNGNGKRLLIAHQMLHARSSATRDDIHWGNLLTNNLRSLPLTDVLNPKADLLRGSDLSYFGEAGHGTGDPASVVVASGGKVLVPLAGVAELALGDDKGWRYIPVGARPTAVVPSPNGQRAYVANTFADSIAIVDLKSAAVPKEIALGPGRDLTASERGEVLFHDARLAHDGWLSCHSCHTDGHSNGQLADTLADGTYGTPKRVLSLRGVGDTGPWAWNGSMNTVETQVRKSIETTMHGKKPAQDQVNDLTAYLKSLPPAPSRARLIGKIDEAAVQRGRDLFASHSCANCHAPPTYTSNKTYDVGLADEAGLKHFNPPSLRGIRQGGPYFHDGRATTLEEVFTKHRHQLKGELPRAEMNDLLTFLNAI